MFALVHELNRSDLECEDETRGPGEHVVRRFVNTSERLICTGFRGLPDERNEFPLPDFLSVPSDLQTAMIDLSGWWALLEVRNL